MRPIEAPVRVLRANQPPAGDVQLAARERVVAMDISDAWVDAGGHQVGTPTAAVASVDTKTITVALPRAAFGDPGP